jgi:hypothetical protein
MASFSFLSIASLLSNQFELASEIPIEEEGGYLVERFISNMDEYLCAICREVCRSPVSINCGHTFCCKCLERSESNFKNQCPQCRAPITRSVPSFNMKMKIDGSQIKCMNYEYGCTFIDAVSRINMHEEECELKHVICIQCKQNCLSSSLENHKKEECPNRLVSCKDCSKMIPLSIMSDHIDECLFQNVTCESCEKEFTRLVLASHQTSECPKQIIPCRYHKYGCEYTCKREDMNIHDEMVNHVPIICQTLDKKMEEWDMIRISQLQNGPFSVSGHGHVVMLCSDLENVTCKLCRHKIPEIKGRFFGYACSNGCPFSLCIPCFSTQRLFRSKRHNVILRL